MISNIPKNPTIEIELLSLELDDRIRLSNLGEFTKRLHTMLSQKAQKEHKTIKMKIRELLPAIRTSTFYDWVNNRVTIPIISFRKLLTDLNGTNVINKNYQSILFSTGKNKFVILPRIFNPRLAYLIGCLHGDGSLSKYYGNVMCYSAEKRYLIEIVGPLFKELFNTNFTVKRHKHESVYILTVCSRPVHSFLANFCPVGKKKNKLKIPNIIRHDKILLKWYLSGLFDADGSLTKIIPSLRSFYNLSFNLTQSSRNFIFDIFDAVKSLDIPINKPYTMIATHPDNREIKIKGWRLEAHSKKTLLPLLKQIELLHPDKSRRKQWIIESYKRLSK